MSKFNQYKRVSNLVDARPVDSDDNVGATGNVITPDGIIISISEKDRKNGVHNCMILRDQKDHNDQWLVSEEWFKQNYEPINN